MNENIRELRAQRATEFEAAKALVEKAEAESRDLSGEEQAAYDKHLADAKALEVRYTRLEELGGIQATLGPKAAPVFNKIKLGDSEERAMAHYFRTGDAGGLSHLKADPESGERGPAVEIRLPRFEKRAVDSTMNVGTAADGGSAVPTGFSGQIALRRNEIMLADRLGVRRVPGVGTTVNFPIENADPSVFAATSEQADNYANTYERDVAPVLATKAFTLAKKTKKLALTEELMDDEDANLMAASADTIGRAIGMTHNSMLITEVGANGTAFKTFASATVIAAGEPEGLVFNSTASFYLDDAGSVAWVVHPTVYGEIVTITGNTRQYVNVLGPNRELIGFPAHYSTFPGQTQASAKSLYFGNWFYVGMREDPALRLINDPYSTDGIVFLKYSFRAVYGVLIAGAVGYGVHPSA